MRNFVLSQIESNPSHREIERDPCRRRASAMRRAHADKRLPLMTIGVHEMDGAWGHVTRRDRPAGGGIECGRDPRALVTKRTRRAGRAVTAVTTNQA